MEFEHTKKLQAEYARWRETGHDITYQEWLEITMTVGRDNYLWMLDQYKRRIAQLEHEAESGGGGGFMSVNLTPDEIAAKVEAWHVARSHFRDNNEIPGTFERLDAELEYHAGDWLRALLDERDRLRAALESIANYGINGEADGTSYAHDCDVMRDRSRQALADQGAGEGDDPPA